MRPWRPVPADQHRGSAAGWGSAARAGQTTRNYIAVDDVDAAIAKVGELGGTITGEKTEIPGMGWYAVGPDSEGNTLALYKSMTG